MAECEECVELAAKIEKLEDELMDANDRANSAERDKCCAEKELDEASSRLEKLDAYLIEDRSIAFLYEEIDLAMNRCGATWVSDSFDAIPRKLVHALRDGVVAFNKRIGG